LKEYILSIVGKATIDDENTALLDGIKEYQGYVNNARGVFLQSTAILKSIESTFDDILLGTLQKCSLVLNAAQGTLGTLADLPSHLAKTVMTAGATLAILITLKTKKEKAKTDDRIDPRLKNTPLPVDLVGAVKDNGGTNILGSLPGDTAAAVEAKDLPIKVQTAIAQAQTEAVALPRSFFEEALADFIRIRNNAVDKFNLGDPVYNEQTDRTPTLSAETSKVPTDTEMAILGAFNAAIRGIQGMLSLPGLFAVPSFNERLTDAQSYFSEDLNLVNSNSVIEFYVSLGDTLETIALEYLLDAARWVEIVELNGLKPPYTLTAGQKILLPSISANNFGNTSLTQESALNKSLTQVERNLGIDIRLDNNFDLDLGNNGDFTVVVGLKNAAQAIILKLVHEKKDLIKHPEVGTGIQIGTKGDPAAVIRTNLVNTILSDARFEQVTNVSITRESNQLILAFDVKIKNVDMPIRFSSIPVKE
jgi:hypothetical protein